MIINVKPLRFLTMVVFLFSGLAHAAVLPAQSSELYYKIGGGESLSLPANRTQTSVPLDASAEVNLGYTCGSFNPALSVANILNSLQRSTANVSQVIITAATGAITALPMYFLSRANPGLYDMLNNQLINAHKSIELSTKSCQMMEADVARGKNPYHDWTTLSIGNDWRKRMSLSNSEDIDINQVKAEVERDNGSTGVPWIGGKSAGGEGQAPIHVIADTVVAGYNSILNRPVADASPPVRTDSNAHLVETWGSPTAAATWVASVLGDKTIKTCPGCKNSSTPGSGLLPANELRTQSLTKKIQILVEQPKTLSKETLEAVSAPGVAVSRDVINAIRTLNANDQAIVIGKLAQEVAMSQTIDQALLAKRALQAGSRVPEIAANHEAQKEIHQALHELEDGIKSLLFEKEVRQQLVSSTVNALLESAKSQQTQSLNNSLNSLKSVPSMQKGAILNQED